MHGSPPVFLWFPTQSSRRPECGSQSACRWVRVALVFTACALTTAFCGGCGDRGGPERVEVSGTVTYNGQPVSEATIRFVPEQGSMAPVSGAQVKDGAYKADQRGGVPVGTHKIEIKAYRKSEMSRPGTPDLLEASKEQQEQYIPAKYNRQSQLEIAIEPGSGKIIKNFDLTD